MQIAVRLAFNERAAVRLLNWLAEENARILLADPQLPGLYESGVRYEREQDETWCDYINLLMQGHEDCDGLAAARAGELLARGSRALKARDPKDPERYPGDDGLRDALTQERRAGKRLARINAEVMLRTRTPEGVPGLYHCIVRYEIGGRWFIDDPSARLGMYRRSQEGRQGLSLKR